MSVSWLPSEVFAVVLDGLVLVVVFRGILRVVVLFGMVRVVCRPPIVLVVRRSPFSVVTFVSSLVVEPDVDPFVDSLESEVTSQVAIYSSKDL